MVAVFVIMATIAIVREEFSEKIDELTSRGDHWEEPACKGVLDPASNAE